MALRTTADVEQALVAALGWGELDIDEGEVASAAPFSATGFLTSDRGLTLRLRTGAEWQITIVQSRRADAWPACPVCGAPVGNEAGCAEHLLLSHGWPAKAACDTAADVMGR